MQTSQIDGVCSAEIIYGVENSWNPPTVESLKETVRIGRRDGTKMMMTVLYKHDTKSKSTFRKAGFRKVGGYHGNDGEYVEVFMSGLRQPKSKVRKGDKKPPAKQRASARNQVASPQH